MNEFLNAEQRVRLACVLQHRKKWGSYARSEKVYMTPDEIMFVLDYKVTISAFNHYVSYILQHKIAPYLKSRGYDGSELS